MKAYHVVGQAPMYTNTFLLISEAGHGVVIDPAAAAADYGQLLRKEGSLPHPYFFAPTATLTMWAAPPNSKRSGTQSSGASPPTWKAGSSTP